MLDEKTFDDFRNDLYNAVSEAFYKYSDGNGSDPDEKDFDKAMAWVKRGFFDTYNNDDEITSGCHGKSKDDKKKKPVKSSVDTSDNPYGFYMDDTVIYDKFGNFWTMGDYFTAPPDMAVEPYHSFDEAEKNMRFHIEDGLLEDEVGGDFDDYCYEFTKFAEKNVPYYIIQSSAIKSDFENEDFEDEDAYMKDLDERLRAQYADENGLDLNEDTINEDDYNEWVHRGAAMYSSVDRNRMNVKALYS